MPWVEFETRGVTRLDDPGHFGDSTPNIRVSLRTSFMQCQPSVSNVVGGDQNWVSYAQVLF